MNPNAYNGLGLDQDVIRDPSRDTEIERIALALVSVDDDSPGVFNELAINDEAARPLAAALYDAGLRSQPASEPSLDVAWKAVETALPEGLALRLHGSVVRRGEAYYAEAIEDLTARRTGHGWHAVEDTTGDSPAAALQALAARLSQRTEPSETDQE